MQNHSDWYNDSYEGYSQDGSFEDFMDLATSDSDEDSDDGSFEGFMQEETAELEEDSDDLSFEGFTDDQPAAESQKITTSIVYTDASTQPLSTGLETQINANISSLCITTNNDSCTLVDDELVKGFSLQTPLHTQNIITGELDASQTIICNDSIIPHECETSEIDVSSSLHSHIQDVIQTRVNSQTSTDSESLSNKNIMPILKSHPDDVNDGGISELGSTSKDKEFPVIGVESESNNQQSMLSNSPADTCNSDTILVQDVQALTTGSNETMYTETLAQVNAMKENIPAYQDLIQTATGRSEDRQCRGSSTLTPAVVPTPTFTVSQSHSWHPITWSPMETVVRVPATNISKFSKPCKLHKLTGSGSGRAVQTYKPSKRLKDILAGFCEPKKLPSPAEVVSKKRTCPWPATPTGQSVEVLLPAAAVFGRSVSSTLPRGISRTTESQSLDQPSMVPVNDTETSTISSDADNPSISDHQLTQLLPIHQSRMLPVTESETSTMSSDDKTPSPEHRTIELPLLQQPKMHPVEEPVTWTISRTAQDIPSCPEHLLSSPPINASMPVIGIRSTAAMERLLPESSKLSSNHTTNSGAQHCSPSEFTNSLLKRTYRSQSLPCWTASSESPGTTVLANATVSRASASVDYPPHHADWNMEEEEEEEEELPDLGSLPADYVASPFPVGTVVWALCPYSQQPERAATPHSAHRNRGAVCWWPGYVEQLHDHPPEATVVFINREGGPLKLPLSQIKNFSCDQLVAFLNQAEAGVYEAYSSASKWAELRRARHAAHVTPQHYFQLTVPEQEALRCQLLGDACTRRSTTTRRKAGNKRTLDQVFVDADLDAELQREDPAYSRHISLTPESDRDPWPLPSAQLSARERRKLASAVKARSRENASLVRFMKSEACLARLRRVLEGSEASELHQRYQDPANRSLMKTALKLGPLYLDEYNSTVFMMVNFLRDHLATLQPHFQDPTQYVILVWLPEAIRDALRVVQKVPECELDAALAHGYHETPTERKARRLFA